MIRVVLLEDKARQATPIRQPKSPNKQPLTPKGRKTPLKTRERLSVTLKTNPAPGPSIPPQYPTHDKQPEAQSPTLDTTPNKSFLPGVPLKRESRVGRGYYMSLYSQMPSPCKRNK